MKTAKRIGAASGVPFAPNKSGFLASFEAASAILLLIVATSALSLFQFQKTNPQEFFLCSDAALIISKSGDFSLQSLLFQAEEMRAVSNLCLAITIGGGETASACEPQSKETFAFGFPVWDREVREANVRCWLE